MKLRPATNESMTDLQWARFYLKTVRQYVRAANCPALLKKINSAIKSADGARRHMYRRMDNANV